MKELVKIQTSADGKKAVSAREMYTGLKLNPTQWKRWAVKNIEKNTFAVEGVDWLGFDIMANGNTTKDYILTLDFAKKLSMQARTEQGEKIRNYFIEVEKVATAQSMASIDGKKVFELETRLQRLEAHHIENEVSAFTVHGYAAYCKKKIAVFEASQIGRMASKKCRDAGLPIGQVKDVRFGLVNTYPETVLYQTFTEFLSKPRF